MYNNRERVPEHPRHFERWADTSQAARLQLGGHLDIAYGRGPNETLDIFPATAPAATQKTAKGSGRSTAAPVLVFIHGGYWRALDKADHSFIAPVFNASGACVVVLNYALCPAVTVPDIVMQMVHALAWIYRNIAQYGGDPQRITVSGNSAGGHLTAMMMACRWDVVEKGLPRQLVRNALAISGLYELESIRSTPHLQAILSLTREQVDKISPAWLPAPLGGKLYTVVGGLESEEYLRQNCLMQQAWGRGLVPVCEVMEGLQHFSILEAMIDPGHRLHALALELLHG